MTTTTESETMAHHQTMVTKMADRYARAFRMVDRDDLIQEGMVALLAAARNYDRNRGASLSTYAWPRVKQSMRRHIGLNPLTHKLEPKDRHMRLDVPFRQDDDRTLLDVLGTSATQEESRMATENRKAIIDALDCLNEKERAAVVGRFFDERVMADIASDLGLTRQRVEQLEKVALGKLRARLLGWHRMAA
jgi:RNA polymerase sigma factor (sigma-70 family)